MKTFTPHDFPRRSHGWRALALSCGILSLMPPSVQAEARHSENYAMPLEANGAAGGIAQSTDYTLSGSAVGEVAGAAAAPLSASNDYVMKAGVAGGIYDALRLWVTAGSATVDETAAVQLAAAPVLDDGTRLGQITAEDVAWSVLNGPITMVSANGIATTGHVYQDTTATVAASFQSLSGQVLLTVRNQGTDDFGTYGSDGIDDAWQVQYFGVGNPLAAAASDPTGSGQNNLLKYLAGLNPLNPASRFQVQIRPSETQPGAMEISFEPALPAGRSYTLQYATELAADTVWHTVEEAQQSQQGETHILTDPEGPSLHERKFYRVMISKP